MQESEIIQFDYSCLRGRIVEKYGNHKNFIASLNIMSYASFNDKLKCRKDFKQNEIMHMCNALEISIVDMHKYFFTLKVK